MVATNDPVANYALICHHQAETTHELVVQRKDTTLTVPVVFAAIENIPGKSASSPGTETASVPTDAVLNIESLGAVISSGKIVSVTPDGPAAHAGLQADDVITMIDGEHHQGVILQSVPFQVGQYASEDVIGLHDQIGIPVVELTPPHPPGVYREWGVRRSHGQVEKKRFVVGSPFGYISIGLFRPSRQELLEMPVWHRRARRAGLIITE